MRLPDDDELYDVDQSYLGPPNRYLGVFRYKVIAAWIIIGPLVFVIMRKVGLPMTLLSVGLAVIGITWLSQKFADRSTAERPVTSLFGTAWNELTAQRAVSKGTRGTAEGYTARAQPPSTVRRWMDRRAREGADR